MSWIEYQRTLLADRVRNEAFERALASVVVKGGTTVVDIGSGTGFLSFLAAKLGAREVLAIEHNEALAALAQALAKRNRVKNVAFLACNSAEVVDLPPADLVVSETLGNYPYEENILEILRDAQRFLAPGGTLMPRAIEQHVAPVVNPAFHEELASWDRTGFGLDFAPARAIGFNNLYVRRFRAEDLADVPPVRWDHVELTRRYASLRKGEASFTAPYPLSIHGFANWWRAELVPGLWLSTSPYEPPTHWEQVYFPVAEPVHAHEGDVVTIAITSDSRDGNGCLLRWTVTHERGKKVLSRQSFDIRKGG